MRPIAQARAFKYLKTDEDVPWSSRHKRALVPKNLLKNPLVLHRPQAGVNTVTLPALYRVPTTIH